MIIAAFPASGKTYFYEKFPDRAVDFESMPYKYCNYYEVLTIYNKELVKGAYELKLRQGWEVEYSKAIMAIENANPNLYILIPPAVRVLHLLKNAGVRYTMVYPKEELLPEYIERSRIRGNSEDFIDVITNFWGTWINAAKADKGAGQKIEHASGQYLTDVVKSVANDYSAEIARYKKKYLPSNL